MPPAAFSIRIGLQTGACVTGLIGIKLPEAEALLVTRWWRPLPARPRFGGDLAKRLQQQQQQQQQQRLAHQERRLRWL